MKLPSFTLIVSAAFLAYISHSMWPIYSLFFPNQCTPDVGRCIHPFLTTQSVELWVYTSKQPNPTQSTSLTLVQKFETFSIHEDVTIEVNVSIPKKTRENGLHAHAFLAPTGSGDPFSSKWRSSASSPLTTFMIPQAEAFSLIGDAEDSSSSVEDVKKRHRDQVISHWRSRLTLSVMDQVIAFNAQDIPPEIYRFLRMHENKYLPILYVDDISNMIKNLMPLNETVEVMPLNIVYRPISVGKLRLWVNMQKIMKMLGFTEKETDEFKGIFADTNFYLLLLTFAKASYLLQMLFAFLAFKNDISYWRARDTMVGLSTCTVMLRSVSTIIVFFYRLDEETSYLVLIPAGIGTIFELWKVKKVFRISILWEGFIPRLQFGLQSDREVETQQFDSQAMKYLSYLLYPLCLGGVVSSLRYTPLKSWYSCCIKSLVIDFYVFGFLFLLPQLFVNYKLKSFAHLPWRAFMYEAFSTVNDHIFAFIITKPTAYRLFCFRDGLVFLVFLYQRWLYPVDKTRVNEYGQSFDETKSVQAAQESKDGQETKKTK